MMAILMTIGGMVAGFGAYFALPLFVVFGVMVAAPMLLIATVTYGLSLLIGPLEEPRASAVQGPLPFPGMGTYETVTADPYSQSATWPSDETGPEAQIQELQARAIPEILEQLPSDGSHTAVFDCSEGHWNFYFKFVSLNARFSAVGTGATPKESFAIALHTLYRQIREWHETRKQGRIYIGVPPVLAAKNADTKNAPRVLIVDDDIDMAMGLETIFKQFGCETEIVTETSDMHRMMSFKKCDFIVLDWMLSEKIRANQVLEKAVRIIDTFSDLQERFENKHPKIVTYSVLDRSQIALPENRYFEHLDHWQKPIQFSELSARTSELLEAHGF